MILFVHKLESVFNLTAPSFLSNRQNLAESDKVLISFTRTVKSAMLADGFLAIKVTNLS